MLVASALLCGVTQGKVPSHLGCLAGGPVFLLLARGLAFACPQPVAEPGLKLREPSIPHTSSRGRTRSVCRVG